MNLKELFGKKLNMPNETFDALQAIVGAYLGIAWIINPLPENEEKSIALGKLQESLEWAIKSHLKRH